MTRAQIEDAMAGLEAEVAALEAAVYPDPEYRGCRACHHIYVGRRGDACPRCGAEPRPQATTYTVRRLGETAWMSGIPTLSAAQREAQRANRICAPGHIVVATTPTGEAAVPPGPSAEGETR